MFTRVGRSPFVFVSFIRCTPAFWAWGSTLVPECYATPLQPGLGHECAGCREAPRSLSPFSPGHQRYSVVSGVFYHKPANDLGYLWHYGIA